MPNMQRLNFLFFHHYTRRVLRWRYSEALTIGLPAVGFADCPGIRQSILPGRNGALALGPDRVQALAQTLETLMTYAHLRERLVTPKPVLSWQFGLEQVLDRWEDLLQQCSR
jgi:hypothetical protein